MKNLYATLISQGNSPSYPPIKYPWC